MKQEDIDRIKRVHDTIKNSPFWINFDMGLYKDVLDMFREFKLYNVADKTNPYYTMYLCISHDFNRMLASQKYAIADGLIDKVDSNVIIVLQSYLSLAHRLCENFNETEVYGYTCDRKKEGYVLNTFKTIYDEEKKEYYAVHILPESKRDSIIELCEKWEKYSRVSKKWWSDALEELRAGKELVMKTWLFKN